LTDDRGLIENGELKIENENPENHRGKTICEIRINPCNLWSEIRFNPFNPRYPRSKNKPQITQIKNHRDYTEKK
jgi:hypothetical protein